MNRTKAEPVTFIERQANERAHQTAWEQLKHIERDIRTRASEGRTMEVCKQLARIKQQRLYHRPGFASFKDCLSSGRIDRRYSTAVEYSRVGSNAVEYAEQLQRIGFDESDGLQKLLYLEQALDHHSASEVFERLKNDAYRPFREFAQTVRAFSDDEQLKLFILSQAQR